MPAPRPLPYICTKCGSHRTEVVGRSGVPVVIIVRCSACGYLFAAPSEPPHPTDASRQD
jgi:uncharacterized Zn finger protein